MVARAGVLALALAVVAGPAGAVPSPAPACAANVGDVVMLRSSDFDPDVLVWDSRARAIAYAAGGVKTADDVLTHTVLSTPGTRAIVLACDPGSFKPRYSNVAEDTVGLKLTTGPHHGRYGWVSSGDVHSVKGSQ